MNSQQICYKQGNNTYYNCGKCYNNNAESDIYLGEAYLLLLLFLHLFFLIKLLYSRNLFPIKQRSPILIALTIVLSFISSITFPLTFQLNPEGGYNPNNFINNLKNSDDQYYETIIYIRSAYVALQSTIFWCIFLRNIRIFVVFETNLTNKLIKFFFANDYGLILILLFNILVQTLFLSNQDKSYSLSTSYFNFNLDQNRDPISKLYYNYWIIIHCLQNLLLPISVYLIRKVPNQFNLTKEAVLISMFYYLQSFMIHSIRSICFSFIPLSHFSADLRNILILVLIVIYPNYYVIIDPNYHLPTSLVLQDHKFLIINPYLRNYFQAYIENRRNKYLLSLNYDQQYCHYEHCNIYFAFIKKFEFINMLQHDTITQSNKARQQQRLQELFDKLVINKTDCYPEYLVSQLYQAHNIDAYIIQQFYEFCNQKVESYYYEFRTTCSFSKIHHQFRHNEHFINRLEQFNLINRVINL